LRLEQAVDVNQIPAFDTGAVHVQDEAAQLAAILLDCHKQHQVLDACAAPGGKLLHLLEMSHGLADVTAIDVSPERIALIRENLARAKLTAKVLQRDILAANLNLPTASFDRILLDAPCTALGVIRRHPDIKLFRDIQSISQSAAQQLAMLKKLWPLLKSGGRLLYATCSIMPQENHEVIAQFLTQQTDAQETLITQLPDYPRIKHGRQILPGNDNMDGFYYCLLTKRN
jgi:16S rRNA (cytosine967-C5)-methyltransferase